MNKDTDAYIERELWDVYHAGRKDDENLAGGNREVLKAKAAIANKLASEVVEANIRLLNDLLVIPSQYIDDGTMVYWSDFNAETLERIIKDRLEALKASTTQSKERL